MKNLEFIQKILDLEGFFVPKSINISSVKEKYRTLPVQVKASLWFLICSFFQKGISTISTPIFTRLLSTADYGHYNVFNSWLDIVTIFVTMRLFSGVYTQGLVKYYEDKSKYSSSIIGLTSTLTVTWTIIYICFHSFWNNLFSLTTVQMLAMLVMIWATAAFNFWSAEQRVDYKYKRLVLITIIVSIAKPVVGIIFVVLSDDKVTARILGLALVELIGYTGLFYSQMKRGKCFFSKKYWKHALLFNIPLIPHYLSQVILSSSDRIMIKNMVGASEAGIYSLAYSISLIMVLFNTSLMQTISPWIYQKIKAKRAVDIEGVAYISMICIAAVNLLLIAVGPEIVRIFAPPAYYEAIWVIPPVAMSVFFMYCYDLFAKFAFYYEKTKFVMIASIVGAALNIGLNYLFINAYGYIAAAYTTLICYIVYCVCHYIFMIGVCKTCNEGIIPYDLKKIFGITIMFLCAGFLIMFTYNFSIIRYIVIATMILCAIIFRKKIMSVAKNLMALKKKKANL